MKKIIVIILLLISNVAYAASLDEMKATAIKAIEDETNIAVDKSFNKKEKSLASLGAYRGTKNNDIKTIIKAMVSKSEDDIDAINGFSTKADLREWWGENTSDDLANALGK